MPYRIRHKKTRSGSWPQESRASQPESTEHSRMSETNSVLDCLRWRTRSSHSAVQSPFLIRNGNSRRHPGCRGRRIDGRTESSLRHGSDCYVISPADRRYPYRRYRPAGAIINRRSGASSLRGPETYRTTDREMPGALQMRRCEYRWLTRTRATASRQRPGLRIFPRRVPAG